MCCNSQIGKRLAEFAWKLLDIAKSNLFACLPFNFSQNCISIEVIFIYGKKMIVSVVFSGSYFPISKSLNTWFQLQPQHLMKLILLTILFGYFLNVLNLRTPKCRAVLGHIMVANNNIYIDSSRESEIDTYVDIRQKLLLALYKYSHASLQAFVDHDYLSG